ncbi:MAG: threonine/serine exporter family protein, partial [Oscillospiraceae bacterium]
VFAIPSSLVITVTAGGLPSVTKTKRIYSHGTDLDAVDRLNALAREICAERPEAARIGARLAEIRGRPGYTPRQMTAAGALCAAMFVLLFGGSPTDALFGVLIGAVLKAGVGRLERMNAGLMLTNILGGAICALCSMGAGLLLPSTATGVLIISTLMLLVPGISITNSMRDLIAGDIVTGMMKLTEALLIATGISIGVMVTLTLWRAATGVML